MRRLRRVALVFLVVLALGSAWVKRRYGAAGVPFPDTSTPPFVPETALEVVARLDEAPGNLAVSDTGRVFFNFHPEGTPKLRVCEWVDGRPVPFPDPRFHWGFAYSVRLDRQGRLWVLETGFHGIRLPRLVAIDIETRQRVHVWEIPREVAGFGSYVQDFRVSPDGRTVYLADVAALAQKPALLVYDVSSGRGRRVLEGDPSVQPKRYEIAPFGKPFSLLGGLYRFRPGVDSIALSADGATLYWGPMAHDRVFRAATAHLRDASMNPAILSRRVVDHGPKPQSDGMAIDDGDTLWITDVEHGAVARLAPDGTLATAIRSPRARWLDGLSFGPDGFLYATDSALPDVLLRTPSHRRAAAPYFIWRFPAGTSASPGQ